MTKTQPNRTTIFIMNLWVNRIRQLAILAVALFFSSCVDETNLIGFKPLNSKFDVKYIELPVQSSVLLFDSLRTSNYSFNGETNRFLVGEYADDKFGPAKSTSCSQFFTTSIAKLDSTAIFKNATIDLAFDNYVYGTSASATPQSVSIYKVDQDLDRLARGSYFNNTEIEYEANPIGAKSFTLDPAVLQTYADKKKDTALSVPLTTAFGLELFESAVDYRKGIDTAFAYYDLFIKKFKGIAIVPNGCDKVFGFSASNVKTKISVYYKISKDTVTRQLIFSFVEGRLVEKIKVNDKDQLVTKIVNVVSFNNIKTTLPAALNGITKYVDFPPIDDKRYIQSGAGIYTKLDFRNFLTFSDTIPNMILNSAELVIGNVEDGGNLNPPQNLALRILKQNNRPYTFGRLNTETTTNQIAYRGFAKPDFYIQNNSNVLIENDSAFTIVGDVGAYYQLSYSKTKKEYTGNVSAITSNNNYLTRFLQQVCNKEENKPQFQYFVLTPSFPVAAKSVNRVVFSKENIKLRIYYTLPTVTE
jgi:hypothetical protein